MFVLTEHDGYAIRPGDYLNDSLGISDQSMIVSKKYEIIYNHSAYADEQ
jgi:hypothetical protein